MKSKKKEKKIGIYGGTFDPTHKGHIAIAQRAMKQLKLDVVYFVPAFIPPHKMEHSSATAKHRLNMVRLAIDRKKYFKISNVELKRQGISYTIDTLKAFRKRYPKAELVLIIGADNLAQFGSWKSPKTIIKIAKLAVYKRKGFDNLLKNISIDFEFIKGKILNISSTEIRKRIYKGKSTSKFLKKEVEDYIRKNHLYIDSPMNEKGNEANCPHK